MYPMQIMLVMVFLKSVPDMAKLHVHTCTFVLQLCPT